MKTAKSLAEPPANRQLSLEVAPYLLFNHLDQTTTSPGKVLDPEQIQIWSLYSRSNTTYPTMVAVLLLNSTIREWTLSNIGFVCVEPDSIRFHSVLQGQ